MRIAIVANDSRGGIQPYVALAVGLEKAGHEVRAIAPSDLAAMFSSAGVPVASLAGSVEAVLRASGGAAERGSLSAIRLGAREGAKRIAGWTKETLDACAGVDVITGGIGGMVMGLSVADKLGVPFVEAHLQPLGAPTDAYPGVLVPGVPRWLGGWAVRASHRLTEAALWMPFRGAMRSAREQVLGLSGPSTAATGQPVLYGFSRHVVPVPAGMDRPRHVTGYWTLPAPATWTPPAALETFLARGGPVVGIGFGSMTSGDAAALTALVLAAVRAAGVRAVLVTAWGGLVAPESSDDVFVIDSVPYDWLYPRMAAVVHHGGAGTTGAGLTAGVPSIVVPFMMDQPFWGARVAALGAGPPPIARSRLTPERLAGALRRTLADEAMRTRAADLGKLLRTEDGVGTAVGHYARLG